MVPTGSKEDLVHLPVRNDFEKISDWFFLKKAGGKKCEVQLRRTGYAGPFLSE
jgi:hypothetical protein